MATTTKTYDITDNNDDGHGDGSSNWDKSTITLGGSNQNPGFRFRNVDISQGVTVNSATLTVKVNGGSGSGGSGDLYGDDADDANAWSDSDLPSDRTKTSASTSVSFGSTGTFDIDVTDQVQEIVNRTGFSENNALALFIIESSVDTSTLDDYSDSDPDVASLEVTFEGPLSDSESTTGGLQLTKRVLDDLRKSRVKRLALVQFPDPANDTTKYWTTWSDSHDATINNITNTYSPRSMDIPDLDRVSGERLSEITLTIDNVDGEIARIANDDNGLYKRRVRVATFVRDQTDNSDVLSIDDWTIEQASWGEQTADVSLTPDLWIQDQQMTETAGRGRFPLAGQDKQKNYRVQNRTTPRTADSNKA